MMDRGLLICEEYTMDRGVGTSKFGRVWLPKNARIFSHDRIARRFHQSMDQNHLPISDSGTHQESLGDIIVNEDVIALYATMAMGSVDGIVSLSGRRGLPDLQANKIKEAIDKGLDIKTDPQSLKVTVNVKINLEYKRHVAETASRLQKAIRDEIEGQCGQEVDRVNVTIVGIVPPADRPA